jgi:hypothetical protein
MSGVSGRDRENRRGQELIIIIADKPQHPVTGNNMGRALGQWAGFPPAALPPALLGRSTSMAPLNLRGASAKSNRRLGVVRRRPYGLYIASLDVTAITEQEIGVTVSVEIALAFPPPLMA